jgi:hypothetical protein
MPYNPQTQLGHRRQRPWRRPSSRPGSGPKWGSSSGHGCSRRCATRGRATCRTLGPGT